MRKQTVVNQREITENGVVQVRLSKQIVEGDKIIRNEYHRFAVEPGVDVDEMVNAVNEHLISMGEEPLPESEVNKVRLTVAAEHTPEIVASCREQMEAQRAAMLARTQQV